MLIVRVQLFCDLSGRGRRHLVAVWVVVVRRGGRRFFYAADSRPRIAGGQLQVGAEHFIKINFE